MTVTPVQQPTPEPERRGSVGGQWSRPAGGWDRAGKVEQQGVAVLKAARYAGAQVIWALAGLTLAAGLVYFLLTKGPPEITVAEASGDRWTPNDQIRFETANNERIGRLERILERMDVLLTSQAQTTNRVLSMMEKQDERIKALEFWRDGQRPGNK